MVTSLLLFLATSSLLTITGLKKRPGIGILISIIFVSIMLLARGENLNSIGFTWPENWTATILLGLACGIVLYLLSAIFIDPLSEKLTKSTHDFSTFNKVRGNWKAYLQLLGMVWIFVAIIEEGLYRGFLMTEVSKIVGFGMGATVLNVIFTSIVFGFSHGYQKRCGILSTGIIGALLGWIFVLNDYNLWVVIFAHGFLDTIALGLIALNKENYFRKVIWVR